MTKAKTNALDALRTLIAERQQYEQWISALDSRREGTPEHVFERVRADYQSRLERVVADIRGHAEELQLSISTLSSRLVEVAREEDTRREGLQEAELRAAVGEYEPDQWEQLRGDAERELARIAGDRASLDNQLSELRAIQKLSEVGSTGSPAAADTSMPRPGTANAEEARTVGASVEPPPPEAVATGSATKSKTAEADAPSAAATTGGGGHRSGTAASPEARAKPAQAAGTETPVKSSEASAARPTGDQERLPLDPVAAAASSAAAATSRGRGAKTPPGGTSAVRGKSDPARPDSAKTLKCPECGTANYPTEWYCERCGGELATM